MEPSSVPPPPWYRRPEVWVFAVVILLRLTVLARYADTRYFLQQMGDMKFYDAWAQRLQSGVWSDGHAFYGLPGYAFLLAGFYALTGPSLLTRFFTVGATQVLIEALTTVIIFRTVVFSIKSEKSSRSENSATMGAVFGAAAALTWATFVPAQTFSVILMPTCWLVCTYWFCVAQAAQPAERSAWHPWPWLGLLIGAMALMVATILFALPLLLARIFLSVGVSRPAPARAGRALLAAALLMIGVGVGTSPAWIHNYFVAHDPVLLTAHSGLNIYMGNSLGATGYPKVPDGLRPSQEGLLKDSILWAEKAAGHPLKRSEVSRYWSERAAEYRQKYPEAWRALLWVKIRNFWNAFQYDDISVITLLKERGVLWPGLRWGAIAALGLAGLALALVRGGPPRWVAAAVLLHMLAILPVFITERYRMAAAPGLIILGAYALWVLWKSVAERRWLLAAIPVLLAGAAAWFVFLPVKDRSLYALDPLNVGVKELTMAELLLVPKASPQQIAEAQAELAHARTHLEAAYAQAPGDAGVNFALGNLWLYLEDLAQARSFYLSTLALNRNDAGARTNLGSVEVRQGRPQEAAEHLREAIKLDPENPRSYYWMAQAQEKLGDLPAARAAAEAALRLAPTAPEIVELQKRL